MKIGLFPWLRTKIQHEILIYHVFEDNNINEISMNIIIWGLAYLCSHSKILGIWICVKITVVVYVCTV